MYIKESDKQLTRVNLVSNMSYTILRGYWCDVLNVYAITEDKNDTEDSFYDKLEQVIDKLPKYHMKIMLRP